MSTSRALVSFTTSVKSAFRADHLKLCCLWYEEVLVEVLRDGDERSLIQRLVEYEENSSKLAKRLSDVVLPVPMELRDLAELDMDMGYPRWGQQNENYDYPEPENAQQYAHNHLLRFIEKEHGVSRFKGWEIQFAEGKARSAVRSISLWQRVNTRLPCMLQVREDEKVAMQAFQQFQSPEVEAIPPFRLLELTVPSLSEVSWEKIWELRERGNMKALRAKITEAADQAGTDLARAKKILDNWEGEAAEAIIDLGRPSVKKVAIESLLANTPTSFLNPVGILTGGRDIADAINKHGQFGWFYLLRDIRKAVQPRDNRIIPI